MLNRTTAILTRTRKLLAQGWCQNCLAKDEAGDSVMPERNTATQWCLIGGMMRASHDLGFDSYQGASRLLSNLTPDSWIGQYNNTHSKADVLDFLDRAIKESVS